MLAKRDQCCSIAIAIAIVEEIRTQIIIYHDAKPVSCLLHCGVACAVSRFSVIDARHTTHLDIDFLPLVASNRTDGEC